MKKNSLLIRSNYFRRFYEIVQTGLTHQDSYYQLEKELLQTFGIKKYKSYESFKNEKSKYFKKTGNQKLPKGD